MNVMISEAERGFLFRKGQFVKMLQPGSYHFWGKAEVKRVRIAAPLHTVLDEVSLALFRKDADFVAQIITQEVPDGKIALHYVDGRFAEGLTAGVYTYWTLVRKHEFVLYDITDKEIDTEKLPAVLCSVICTRKLMQAFTVPSSQVGFLLADGKFQRMLEPGIHYFWNGAADFSVQYMETRKRELSLNGQEILTKDKVGVRLNFVCSYRVTDCLKAYQEIEDYESLFYTAVQLTVREYVASVTLDELLLQRDVIAEKLLEILRPKAEKMYIEVTDAGIRDIILPGDVRDILNTVLLAEKRAQANVITRREEVASTRSLLNTAKLMDENKTLYKLKELEYLEKICENVGNISVSGGDLLEHLRAIVHTGS